MSNIITINNASIKVIIDIGARDTTYPIDYPDAECHLFEPSPKHIKVLKERFADWPVILNEFGISDRSDVLNYDENSESFVIKPDGSQKLQVHSLDEYVKRNNIKRIDLLKVDTEGMDYAILKGNPKAVKMAKFIVFEDWDNIAEFKKLLGKKFYIVELGERNYLCKRKW